MKKHLLNGPYFPDHSLNRMDSVGDVASAKERFALRRFRNLDHLLRARFNWMNEYIHPHMRTIEVGSGAGFSELYLTHPVIMTDAAPRPWIALVLDATNMGLAEKSVDCIIASHNIHHFHSPYRFFKECERVLRPNGLVLVQELNTSLLLRGLLRLMRHEGWSYDVDVFDQDAIANDPSDPWSANCAIPELIFERPNRFEEEFTTLRVERNELCECLIFPLSGGVISKTRIPELPQWVLSFASSLDRFLIGALPDIFAMGRSVVLRKTA